MSAAEGFALFCTIFFYGIVAWDIFNENSDETFGILMFTGLALYGSVSLVVSA